MQTMPVEVQIEDILLSSETLHRRIAELGRQISEDYADKDPLLIGVLKGAVFFMSDLVREITVPCSLDFMAVSSYGNALESSGVVKILKDLDTSIENRHVIIVEDIIDSGLTLSHLIELLGARRPHSIEVCALLTKPERREVEIDCRYVGFEIPNKFVIGYGLDYQEHYRNLDYIATVDESALPEG